MRSFVQRGSGQERFARTGRAIHKDAFRRLDTKVFEFLLLLHGKYDGFDELFDLLVETTNVRICFCGSFIDFHGLYTRIVF